MSGNINKVLLFKALSEEQSYLIPDNAQKGDYVGFVKAYPEYEYLGMPPSFKLKNHNSKYELNSNGLLTVKREDLLKTGVDTFTVIVSKKYYLDTYIKLSVNVVKSSACIFVDYSSATNGNGTRQSPKNRFEPNGNTIFLFKRGTIRLGKQVSIRSHQNIILDSYGIGENFTFSCSDLGNARVLGVGFNCKNITICNINFRFENYSFKNTETTGNACVYFPKGAGTNFTIKYCELYNAGGGVSSSASSDTFKIEWCRIRNIALDGIFFAVPGVSTNIVKATYIHDVNELFYLDKREAISGGDNLQNDQPNTQLLNCLFDHSSTGNKFCVITGAPISIKDCYFINHPDRVGFYSIRSKSIVEGCTFVGGYAGVWAHSGEEIKIHYSVFVKQNNSSIVNQGAKRITLNNNLFYHSKRSLTGGKYLSRNNIFILSNNQVAYQNSVTINSDYNLFNKEFMNMLGQGTGKLKLAKYGNEKHSMAKDPLFINESEMIFKVDSLSPVIRAGVSVDLFKDFEGMPIKFPNSPNIGIYE